MRINELSDLIRRRTYILLPDDGIDRIYINTNVSPTQVVFVLDRDVSASELATLRVKYKRVFGDKESDISVIVRNYSEYCGVVGNFSILFDSTMGYIL